MNVKPNVLVTASIHEEAWNRLRDVAEIQTLSRHLATSKTELLKIISNFEGVIIGSREPFDKEVINSGKKLQVISRFGVGYNNVDTKAAAKKGIYVTITPVLCETVADLTFGLMISATRRIPQAWRYVKEGKWGVETGFFTGTDIHGKTLGIIGLGRIGSAVAKRAKGFAMDVLYYDLVRNIEMERKLCLKYVSLEALLSQADIVTIHVPLTDRTMRLIGERELKLMKPTAYLINTSRGPTVDETALYTAVNEGWIAGAGLDVFSEEPVNPENPLLSLKNIIYTPHIASSTLECRYKMAMMSVENTIRVLKQKKPLHYVTS
jgi:D-3-phosphoglycerate dehydrogenase